MGSDSSVGFIGSHGSLAARVRSMASYRDREGIDGCLGLRLRGNGSDHQVAVRDCRPTLSTTGLAFAVVVVRLRVRRAWKRTGSR